MVTRISGSSPVVTPVTSNTPAAPAAAPSVTERVQDAAAWVGLGQGSARTQKAAAAREAAQRSELTSLATTQAQAAISLRGAPRQLEGVSLTNEVGAALHLTPNRQPKTPDERRAFDEGSWNFYTGAEQQQVQTVGKALEKLGGSKPQVTVIPLAVRPEGAASQPVVVPLFRVETQKGPAFVDNLGRQYASLADWKSHNQLPAGTVSYPKELALTRGATGSVSMVTENTTATVDTLAEKALQVADTVALVGGFVVGAAAIIGTGGAAVPLVGAALSAWSASRAAASLYDSAAHGGALNPLTDANARSEWLTFASSAVGLGSMGATVKAAGELAKTGQVVSALGKLAPELTVASQVAGQAATVDGAVSLTKNWDQMTVGQKLSATSQLVFAMASTGQAVRRGGLKGLYSPQAVREQLGMAEKAVAEKKELVAQSPTDLQKLKARDFFHESEENPAVHAAEANAPTGKAVYDPKTATTTYVTDPAAPPPPEPLSTAALADQAGLERLRGAPELNQVGVRGRLMAARLIGRERRTDGDFRYAYGRETFKAWSQADARLTAVPKGSFGEQLSVGLLQELNGLVVGGKSASALRTGDARSAPFRPEAMAEVKNVQANGAQITTLHSGDVGEVAIVYPKASKLAPALEQLVSETRAALKAPGADVVEVGASFSQRLASLHPFEQGNERTARLVLDRILAEADVPPPIFKRSGAELTLDKAAYATEVRNGAARMKLSLQDSQYASDNTMVALTQGGFYDPGVAESATVGGQTWARGNDGFVRDATGRNYVADADGKLRPMSQLEHYLTGRRLAMQPDPKAALAAYTAGNEKAFGALKAQGAGPERVALNDEPVIAADNAYQLGLPAKGNERLLALLDPAKADVNKLFQPQATRYGSSNTFVMSRYAQHDLELWHAQRGLTEAGDRAGAEQVMGYRRTLFTLAKQALAESAANPLTGTEARPVAPKSASNPYGFAQEFERLALEASPLKHASLDEAISTDGDSTVKVWRGDIFMVDRTGIYPDYVPTRPDARQVAKEYARSGGTGNITRDLGRVAGSSLGTGYLCYTSDLALLAQEGGFADKRNVATVSLGALPPSLKSLVEARVPEKGTVRLGGVRDLFATVFGNAQARGEKTLDVRGLTRQQFSNIVDTVGESWPAESRATLLERYDAAARQGGGLFGAPQVVKLEDVDLGSDWAHTSLQEAVGRSVGAIELTRAGDTLTMNTSRRAFLVEMDKRDSLPGVNTLGGTFETEQEVTSLGKVLPNRIKGSYSQLELATGTEGAPPVPKPAGYSKTGGGMYSKVDVPEGEGISAKSVDVGKATEPVNPSPAPAVASDGAVG